MSDTTNVATRDSIRGALFKGRKFKSVLFPFFGVEIELRQSSLGELLDTQTENKDLPAVIQMLLKCAYLPGTDEKLFEVGDIETLKSMPADENWERLSKAIQDLQGADFPTGKPGSSDTPNE